MHLLLRNSSTGPFEFTEITDIYPCKYSSYLYSAPSVHTVDCSPRNIPFRSNKLGVSI